MFRSRILGLGAYVPARVVTNHDLAKVMETSHEWMVERSGIEERRWVEPGDGETGYGMAAKASRAACEQAGVDVKDVDMIVYATLSPDHNFPGGAVFMQRELGLGAKAIPALDIR